MLDCPKLCPSRCDSGRGFSWPNAQEQHPEQLAEQVQALVDTDAVAVLALPVINQGVGAPFGHTQGWNARQKGHDQAMNGGMAGEPPLPGKCGVLATAFLGRHPVALQAEVPEEMAHGQQGQQFPVLFKQHDVTAWRP